MADANWKTRIGAQTYSPGQTTDEDDIDGSVVEKQWRGLDELAAEYDHLGTTPPRTRIRNKEKHRSSNVGGTATADSPKIVKVSRRNTVDNIITSDGSVPIDITDKKAKRRSLKTIRGHERDLKLDISRCKSCRTDSTSRVIELFHIPTLVESCNRFMSLCSRPVCPASKAEKPPAPLQPLAPDSRLIFHNTFSMVIRMGNSDKGCKRTISVEEHTWQNELKDLVWLEVSARRAGRTVTQQDAFLCNHRDSIPALLQEILDYRFVNTENKCSGVGVWTTQSSVISNDSGVGNSSPSDSDTPVGESVPAMVTANPLDTITEHLTVKGYNDSRTECLCIDCRTCSQVISRAMREVSRLLDALANAEALYPSSKAMAVQHPVITTEAFINKHKAMCLWYNMVHHQRLKLLIIKKLLHTHTYKSYSKDKTEKTLETQGETFQEKCANSHNQKVKFNMESSSASDTNSSSDTTEICKVTEDKTPDSFQSGAEADDDQSDDDNDVTQASSVHIEITRIQSTDSDIIQENGIKGCLTKSKDRSSELLNVKSNKNILLSSKESSSTKASSSEEQPRSPYESADSSAGSVNSTESGFVSSVNDNYEDSSSKYLDTFNVFELGSLGEVTNLKLYYPNKKSPYRDYIEKILKVRGIKRALYFLEKLHLGVLKKARMTLEKYEPPKTENFPPNPEHPDAPEEIEDKEDYDSDDDFEYERHNRCEVDVEELKKEYVDLQRYGAWSKEFIEMGLPSYRSIFLFMSTLPLENIYQFFRMKVETKPEKPSLLSIKQIISEMREGLTIAVRIRTRFIKHIHTALMSEPENSKCRKFYDGVLATFDATMEEVYKQYLSYLSDWAGMEHLPRAVLSAEWSFNCFLARHLRIAATMAPLTFCCLTVRQLDGAANRLKQRVTELGETADLLVEGVVEEVVEDMDNTIKWRILGIARDMQCLLTEERERTLSTAQFARTVSMHLHHNAVFRDYRQKVYNAMATIQKILCWTIARMQETTSPRRLQDLEEADRPSVQSRTREILSQGYKFGFEFHKEMCRLINDTLSPESNYNSCARNSLTANRRPKFIRSESVNDNNHTSIEDNYYSLNPYTPTANQEFVYPPANAKTNNRAISKEEDSFSYMYRWGLKKARHNMLRNRKFPSFDTVVDGTLLADLNLDDFKSGIPGCDGEACCILRNGKDETDSTNSNGTDLSNVDWEEMVSRSLVQFSKQWMNFALERCERGRGLRPRWANHGLEFLMLTCDPRHTKHLTDVEFEELKAMMDGCISHVIGSSRAGGLAGLPTPPSSLGTPTPQRTRSSIHYPQHPLTNRPVQPAPSSPSTEPPTMYLQTDESGGRLDRKLLALQELDSKRDAVLRDAGAIGSVRRVGGGRDHFRPRPVTFKWQRGIKIGQGRFGKVYTVVNTETGHLLAMKEVSLGVGDRRAVERAANELQVLEGVVHPNLVRYYGVEIHREEMLIFMELCVEGSLEAMVAEAGGGALEGLPEQLVRRYTEQLVSAVHALHGRAIAHRDIKSGNIFLTEGGNSLKLGDFGCAVKIRANTTVPGELQGCIGTQAYMAPEVFMKSSGHGRAADIWSLGCVVVEMATGKRPWSEYDSNYQIMFVVGMGGRPEVPPTLSSEGADFCLSCLQHDPAVRASAETLSHHHFLKGNHADDY